MKQIHLTVGEHTSKRLNYLSSADIYEIFPDSFMETFTQYKNFTDFCQAIGCDITTQKDLDKLQDSNAFDNSIQSCSSFKSWQDMVQTAYQKLLDKK